MHGAVIRSKLVYGMSMMARTQAQMSDVDAFQPRGLCQILRMRYPYVDRANTNARVFEVANGRRSPKGGGITSFAQFYHEQGLFYLDMSCACRRIQGGGGVSFRIVGVRCFGRKSTGLQTTTKLDDGVLYAGAADGVGATRRVLSGP